MNNKLISQISTLKTIPVALSPFSIVCLRNLAAKLAQPQLAIRQNLGENESRLLFATLVKIESIRKSN